jgi:LssY C-terminus
VGRCMIQQILMRRMKLVSTVLILVAAPSLLVGQVTGESAPGSSGQALATKEFVLKGTDGWTDTELVLKPGQHIAVTASGRLQYADAQITNGPDGLNRGFKDLLRILPFNGAGRGALIARVGDADYAQPFLLGSNKDVVSPVGGKLWIGMNQSASDTGEGSYEVKLKILPADATGSWGLATPVDNIPGVDNFLFAKIPRRISDKAGNPGDMVNFLILGTEEQMRKVFTTAGWVKVDSDVRETLLKGAIASLSKESYLTMPMSPLYLFGRAQDFGWAHAEPIAVVASRNHLRIWKAPFTAKGQTVWVGAATHDIGFERDQRNDNLTHKIDPDIDLERKYVEKTLSGTGLVDQVSHFLPNHPVKEAKTATGGSFHSNGEVLVLKLIEPVAEPRVRN